MGIKSIDAEDDQFEGNSLIAAGDEDLDVDELTSIAFHGKESR